jgi:CSLREA domain-containing protein
LLMAPRPIHGKGESAVLATDYFIRRFLALVAMMAVALLAGPMAHNDPAWAQTTTAVPGTTITVNTTDDETTDDGNCSLREAIEAANTNAPVDACKAGSATERDAIHFSLGKKATIVLGSQLPTITDPLGLTINGQKAKITVSGNHAVRVFQVNSEAKLTLKKLTVAHGKTDFGAGIFNNGTLTVTNSTFSGNSATSAGGGIFSLGGTTTVTNSTFSGNSANFAGGGIASFGGTLTVTNSTFSGNSATSSAGAGGGIANTSTATLRNTVMANSPSGGNCAGTTITDGGYNIDDGTTCGFSAANHSMPSTDPQLAGRLANNGGPTKTIALKKGSPAIDAIPKGTNGCGTEIKEDQRGVKRPQGPGCDIGAFERSEVSRV